MPSLLLLVNLAATLYMTGLIWFVQVVHYPLFGKVGEGGFAAYASAHSQRTLFVVGPPMLIELATAGLLALRPPANVPAWTGYLGLLLVGVLWASTAFLQVPKHGVLGGGFDTAAHRFLVASNWLRTFVWTGRSLLLLWMVWTQMLPTPL